jgi:5-methylphenazine-1-carboxylate 1-monooxygenase
MNVIVVGAGIGGLTAALSLHAAGMDVRVYESVGNMKALGFGINLQPNAARELIELGLGDALAETAIETARLGYYNKLGQLIWSEPRGRAAGYAWPQYAIERGDLQMILLNAVRARIGAGNIFTGHHLVSFEQDGTGVNAHFIERGSGQALPPARSDVLIGCDGIHSTVRAQLYPGEGPPVGSGRVHCRGAVEAEPFLGGRTHATMGFSDQRAVIYPISRKAADRGCSRLSWVVVVPALVSNANLAWGRKVTNDLVVEPFKDWNFTWLNFVGLIRQTADIYEYPEADRDPLPRWSFGRVTLLGDAAHPMRPVGAQAGSQAVIDARVLAFALAKAATPERALEQYDAHRRPTMNAVVMRNREFGPAVIMELAEKRAPHGFSDIEHVISRRELKEISRAYKTEAGFDPAELNQRHSLTIGHTEPTIAEA